MTDEERQEENQSSPALEVPTGRRGRRARSEAQSPVASRNGLLLVMALVGVGGGIAALALGGLKDNAMYSKPVDQLLADSQRFVGRPVRTDGLLVHGTLERRDSPCEYKFSIEKNKKVLPVHFGQCVVPDNFRDTVGMDIEVTVEGELKANGMFEANTIVTKCPSKYEQQEMQAKGVKAPHLIPQPSEQMR